MSLAAHARAIDTLSTPYARALARWAAAFVRAEAARAARDPSAYVVGLKQDKPKRGTLDDLRRLLLLFGLRHGVDAGREAGSTVMRPAIIDDAIANKPIRIRLLASWVRATNQRARAIVEDITERVREQVRTILTDGERRTPRATVGEITRRIATEVRASPPDSADEGGVFSWARAQTIARTELAQVENTARVAAYEETGVEQIEWLAYSDGRSGDRHHERMRGARVRVGDSFVLPSGARLRYPGDPLGPVGETANCRCSVKPVRRHKVSTTETGPT